MKRYTIHTRTAGGTFSSRAVDGENPQDAVDRVLRVWPKSALKPVAWTEGTKDNHPSEQTSGMRKEALLAGRLIEEVDGKYFARTPDNVGVPGGTTPFRIGGIYRMQGGGTAVLEAVEVTSDMVNRGLAKYGVQLHEVGRSVEVTNCDGLAGGWHSLITGKYLAARAVADHGAHLLPGDVGDGSVPVSEDQRLYDELAKPAKPEPAKPATLADSTDPRDAKMIAADGPSRESTAKPALPRSEHPRAVKVWPGALHSPDLKPSDHRVSPLHGSAHLWS